jgi:hypothetical protein
VTVSDDVTLTDEAAVTNGEFGAIAFAGGDAQGITVAGNPSRIRRCRTSGSITRQA